MMYIKQFLGRLAVVVIIAFGTYALGGDNSDMLTNMLVGMCLYGIAEVNSKIK